MPKGRKVEIDSTSGTRDAVPAEESTNGRAADPARMTAEERRAVIEANANRAYAQRPVMEDEPPPVLMFPADEYTQKQYQQELQAWEQRQAMRKVLMERDRRLGVTARPYTEAWYEAHRQVAANPVQYAVMISDRDGVAAASVAHDGSVRNESDPIANAMKGFKLALQVLGSGLALVGIFVAIDGILIALGSHLILRPSVPILIIGLGYIALGLLCTIVAGIVLIATLIDTGVRKIKRTQ